MIDDPLDWLFGLAQFGVKFGLHNIQTILQALGQPERAFRSIHVAGTNGKGSVTAIVETSLRAAGLRTGRYTSPHLLDLSERFAIDGTPIATAALRAAAADVRETVERLHGLGSLDVHPTFFEVTTAIAFELFRRAQVDVAVCEVGLGGRLDATNVLSPMVTAITSIGLDHEQYLGRTLRDIASEKAGIIKPATPVVVGPVDADAAVVIRDRAATCRAPLTWAMDGVVIGAPGPGAAGQQFSLRTPRHDYGAVTLALAGAHQVTNAVVSVRLLEQLGDHGVPVNEQAIVRGLAEVHWPGRLQRVVLDGQRELLLDAAHNVAGAAALVEFLHTLGPSRPLVFAAMRDKDVAAMLGILAPAVSSVVITRSSNPRSAAPEDLAAQLRRLAPALPVAIVEEPGAALAHAWAECPHIVVAGSIFLVADVMKALRLS